MQSNFNMNSFNFSLIINKLIYEFSIKNDSKDTQRREAGYGKAPKHCLWV